jgi:hypothetical protein
MRRACEDEAILNPHDFHLLCERCGEGRGRGGREHFRIAEVFLREQDIANKPDVLPLKQMHQQPVRVGLPRGVLNCRDEQVGVQQDESWFVLGHPRGLPSSATEGRELPNGERLDLGLHPRDDGP